MKFSFFKRIFEKVVPVEGPQRGESVLNELQTSRQPAIDGRKAECPYCKGALKKTPGAKTKCPHCGQFMYVCTSPTDNTRKVVTRVEADRIEEDWALASGTYDTLLAEKQEVEKVRKLLTAKLGKEPSEHDVEWGLLNKNIVEHARQGDWGLYRNDRFAMGELLRKERQFQKALCYYLEVCYLDLNGPNNTGATTDPEILAEFPPFNPNEFADLAPGVIDRILTIKKRLSLEKEAVKVAYFDHCARVAKNLHLPRTLEDSWVLIEREL